MYAVDDLSDAIDVTRGFLTPIHTWTWIRLAIVVFFVGSMGFGGSPLPFGDVGTIPETQPLEPAPESVETPDVAIDELLVVGVILLAIIGPLYLLFAFIAALMEFVFIESLRKAEVHVRRYGSQNFGRALHLLLFRLVVGIGAIAIVAVPGVFIWLGTESIEHVANQAILLILFAIVVYAFYTVIMRFTSEFVAPVMLLKERGILSAWSRFLPTFRSYWKEYVVYLLLVWIIQIVVNIAAGFLVLLVGIVLAIPFFVLVLVLATLGDVGVILAVITVVVGVLLFILVVALIWVPIATYFKYYALLLLGDTDADLDLIPDQRDAIRSDEREEERDDRTDRDEQKDRWGDSDDDDDVGDDVDDYNHYSADPSAGSALDDTRDYDGDDDPFEWGTFEDDEAGDTGRDVDYDDRGDTGVDDADGTVTNDDTGWDKDDTGWDKDDTGWDESTRWDDDIGSSWDDVVWDDENEGADENDADTNSDSDSDSKPGVDNERAGNNTTEDDTDTDGDERDRGW